jgi:hypothetical protein
MCNISMPKHRRTCQMFSIVLKLSIMIRIFMPVPCVLPVLLHHVPTAIRSCNQNYMETEEGAQKDGAIVHIAIPGFGMWYNCRLYHERKTLKPCVFIKASKLQKNCKRHILSWSHLLSHSHILISLNNTKHSFPFVITIIFGPIAISCAFFLKRGHTCQYFMQRFSHSKLLTSLLLECICKMICTKTWHVGVSPPTL